MTSPRDATLDLIFRNARTHGAWTDRPVTETTLREVWELAKLGPTSANGMPGRIVFVVSPEAKAKLKPALIANNVAKTMSSPVTAIIAHDLEFYEKLPTLYPQTDARSWFVGNPSLIEATAFRNGSLQGAYFMIAARACGLDCGPMSGFDNAVVDEAFFSGTSIRSNFLCNLGYAESAKARPRNPRLDFDEVCRIV